MTLALRIKLVRLAVWPVLLAIVGSVAVAGEAVEMPTIGVIGLLVLVGVGAAKATPPLLQLWLRRAGRRRADEFNAAVTAGDAAAIERTARDLENCHRLTGNAVAATYVRAQLLAEQERWTDALAALATPDGTSVLGRGEVIFDNDRAWYLAHAGAAGEAVALAESAVARAATVPADLRPYLFGTFGVALVRDGRFAEALEPLRTAIELGGPAWAQAIRHFYTGEAFDALKRQDDARAAWERAQAVAPKSRFGMRAAERLSAPAPSAYR